ncbi:MAG TPA: hypothetical protein VIG72_05110 [Pontibacter sp.]
MKKIIVLLAVLCCTYSSLLARQQPKQQGTAITTVEYVRVHISPFLLRKNYTAHLSYGWGNHTSDHITDASGKKMEFPNPTGVLNYMGSQGWEFVAYIPDDDGKLSDRVFLMKRTAPTAKL